MILFQNKLYYNNVLASRAKSYKGIIIILPLSFLVASSRGHIVDGYHYTCTAQPPTIYNSCGLLLESK